MTLLLECSWEFLSFFLFLFFLACFFLFDGFHLYETKFHFLMKTTFTVFFFFFFDVNRKCLNSLSDLCLNSYMNVLIFLLV